MDMLLFWVTLGFLVEATRAVVRKCCLDKRKKEVNPLKEPLLKSEEVLDESGKCQLSCCAHRWEKEDFQEESDEEYYLETSEEESVQSFDLLRVTTDESEEDFEEHGVRIVKWDNLLDNVTVTLMGDRGRRLKGKEIVEEQEDEITESDLSGSDIIHSRTRNPSLWKNSAKIYPEPLDSPLTSTQAEKSRHSGHSSYYYRLKITDPSAWDSNFKADIKVPSFTGESSKS